MARLVVLLQYSTRHFWPKRSRKSSKNPKFREPSQNLPLVLWRCWEHFVSSLWGLWSSVIGWEVIPELFCVSAPASETEFYIGFWYTISASEAATWGSNRLGCQRLVHCMITWSTDKRMAPKTQFPYFRFLYDFTSSSWYRISPQNRYQTNSEWSIGGRIVNIMSPNDTTHNQRSKRLPKPHIPAKTWLSMLWLEIGDSDTALLALCSLPSSKYTNLVPDCPIEGWMWK